MKDAYICLNHNILSSQSDTRVLFLNQIQHLGKKSHSFQYRFILSVNEDNHISHLSSQYFYHLQRIFHLFHAENVTVVIVVTIVKQNESYDKPGANVSVKDDDTQYNVGSALIQINTYVNNEIFSLTQFDFKTTYKVSKSPFYLYSETAKKSYSFNERQILKGFEHPLSVKSMRQTINSFCSQV